MDTPPCERAGCNAVMDHRIVGFTFTTTLGDFKVLIAPALDVCERHADDDEIELIATGMLAGIMMPLLEHRRPGSTLNGWALSYAAGTGPWHPVAPTARA